MAVRLSRKELLAGVEELKQQVPKPPRVQPPTENGYSKILKHWDNYTARLQNPSLIPDANTMKIFFKMLALEQRGMIGKRLSLNTLTPYATRFATAYKRKYKFHISKETVAEVKQYILTDLKKLLQLSSAPRPKPLMVSQDLDALLRFLWVRDSHHYKRELLRVQLTLYLLILAYTAARPGAVIVSDAHRNSDDCLRFKDLKFRLSKDAEGGPPDMSLTITFRLMKGCREDDDKFLIITLWEDRVFPHLCPIMPFLSLAFLYGAFEFEPAQLFRSTLHRDVVDINFKESVLETPVFRSYDGVTPWKYSGMHMALTGVTYRMGYKNPVGSYAVRRGAANALDKSTTWAEKGLIFGHKNPKTLQAHYIHKHIGVDIQSIFHNQPANTDRLRPLRSLAVDYFPDAPSSLRGTKLHQELRQHPRFLERRREWTELKQSKASTGQIVSARRKMDCELRRLRDQETKKIRDEWIQSEGTRHLQDVPENCQTQAKVAGNETRDSLPPHRAEVVDYLFAPKEYSSARSLSLVEGLLTLLTSHTISKEYFCSVSSCKRHEKGFTTNAALRLHEDRVHQHRKVQTCPKCPQQTFHSKEDLQAHKDKFHESFQSFCPFVDCPRNTRPLKSDAGLTRHIKAAHKSSGEVLDPIEELTLEESLSLGEAPRQHLPVPQNIHLEHGSNEGMSNLDDGDMPFAIQDMHFDDEDMLFIDEALPIADEDMLFVDEGTFPFGEYLQDQEEAPIIEDFPDNATLPVVDHSSSSWSLQPDETWLQIQPSPSQDRIACGQSTESDSKMNHPKFWTPFVNGSSQRKMLVNSVRPDNEIPILLADDGLPVSLKTSLQHHCKYNKCRRHKTPFMTKAGLDLHYKEVHSFPIVEHHCPLPGCSRQGKPIVTKAGFARHIQRCQAIQEARTQRYFCPSVDCPRHHKPFPSAKELKRHVDRVHKTRIWTSESPISEHV